MRVSSVRLLVENVSTPQRVKLFVWKRRAIISYVLRIEQCKLQISGWKHELDQLDDADVQNEIDQLNRVIRSTLSAIGQVEHEQSLVIDQKERNLREIEGELLVWMKHFDVSLSYSRRLREQVGGVA